MTQDEKRWISVEDVLPPKGAKPVLVWAGNNMIVGKYYRAQKRWISVKDWRYIYSNVTHWRLLPAAPEVDDE